MDGRGPGRHTGRPEPGLQPGRRKARLRRAAPNRPGDWAQILKASSASGANKSSGLSKRPDNPCSTE
jgi:hypothetical protein